MNSHPIPPISNFINKKKEKIQGGTRPKPSEKTENQQQQKDKIEEETK